MTKANLFCALLALSMASAPRAFAQPAGAPVAAASPDPAPALRLDDAPPAGKPNGHAAIKCGVTAVGLLTDCVLLYEEPDGRGYGLAALKMAKRFRLKPGAKLADDGTYTLRLAFNTPND